MGDGDRVAGRRRVVRRVGACGWGGERGFKARRRVDGRSRGGARLLLEGEGELGRCGRGREQPRWHGNAERGEALLGGLAGGVEGADGPSPTARAAQDVGAEGALVKRGPPEPVEG